MKINVNINNLIYDLMPTNWRTLRNFQFLQTGMKGLRDLSNYYYNYQNYNEFELLHNSQVMSMEDYLNYRLKDVFVEKISIENGNWIDNNLIFFQKEYESGIARPIFFDNNNNANFFYFQSDYENETSDFIIYVKNIDNITTNIKMLVGFVHKIKLAGTFYKIKII